MRKVHVIMSADSKNLYGLYRDYCSNEKDQPVFGLLKLDASQPLDYIAYGSGRFTGTCKEISNDLHHIIMTFFVTTTIKKGIVIITNNIFALMYIDRYVTLWGDKEALRLYTYDGKLLKKEKGMNGRIFPKYIIDECRHDIDNVYHTIKLLDSQTKTI